MGYCMQQLDTSFYIPAKHVAGCIAAVKRFAKTIYYRPMAASPHDKSNWGLEDAMAHFDWSVRFDGQGNAVDIFFEGQKLLCDRQLFEALAPYVQAGSYIVMAGEDYGIWRWYFDGKSCREQNADISFAEPPQEHSP